MCFDEQQEKNHCGIKQNYVNVTEIFSMEKNEKGKPHILLQFLLDYAEALCLKMKTTIHLSPEIPKKIF